MSKIKKPFVMILFLLGTAVCGLILRLQMAGVDFGAAASLDWRRAHSHLGYYGFLFPAAWLCWAAAGRWAPVGKWFGFYAVLVVASFAGFLAQGYGLLATVSSSLVLAVWLCFAWKNRAIPGIRRGSLLNAVPLNVLFAACCIPVIALVSSRSPAHLIPVVRMFMTILMLGVFVPSILSAFALRSTVPILWVILPLLSAVDAAGFSPGAVPRAGTIGYGVLLAISVLGVPRPSSALPFWLAGHWLFLAGGLVLHGLGFFPKSQPVVIAGLHFLVLGPILLSLTHARLRLAIPTPLHFFYQGSLTVMAGAIILQQWYPADIGLLQRVAAGSGAAVVLGLALMMSLFRNRA